jgi:phosphatidylinositol phospholipase C, beta
MRCKSMFALHLELNFQLLLCSVGTSKRRIMSTTQLVEFLNKTQRDPRLNEILHPYANPARAKDLIQEYEPNKFNAQKGLLSFDGFLR